MWVAQQLKSQQAVARTSEAEEKEVTGGSVSIGIGRTVGDTTPTVEVV